MSMRRPNQAMELTAPLRCNISVIATAPLRSLISFSLDPKKYDAVKRTFGCRIDFFDLLPSDLGAGNRGRDEESDRSTKEQAIGYAQVRACFRSGEIRIVDNRHYLKHSSGL